MKNYNYSFEERKQFEETFVLYFLIPNTCHVE